MVERSSNKPTPVKWQWHNKLKTLINLRWHRGIPRLVVHEKYQGTIKWSLRVLTLIGIVSSVLYIPFWYLSLLLSLVLLAIEQFLERAIFLYTIFYLQPMPNFSWNVGTEWITMGFAFPAYETERDLNLVGPVFSSESCAHEFFELLREWNYGRDEDEQNNICLSFITTDGGYYTYIYPNSERPSVNKAFSDIEESQKLQKYGKEPQKFIMQQTFCKRFNYSTNSLFKRFAEEQTSGKPYWLQPFLQSPNEALNILFSEQPILKYHIKIKQLNELAHNEVEYQHFKNVIEVDLNKNKRIGGSD